MTHPRHPAKYSDVLLPYFDRLLPPDTSRILDPFGGTGKLRLIRPSCVLIEIEPEWARISGAIVGDATALPFCDASFDAICTSPTYGNRMADHFADSKPEKQYRRYTYRHSLGRALAENNSGKMQWGPEYQSLHERAWKECVRVLRPGGLMLVNISDHIRKCQIVPVTEWHRECLVGLGLRLEDHLQVVTRRQRHGQHAQARVPFESILVFRRNEIV